jgi:hypothetical protein
VNHQRRVLRPYEKGLHRIALGIDIAVSAATHSSLQTKDLPDEA